MLGGVVAGYLFAGTVAKYQPFKFVADKAASIA
jgi:hypothetical protein